MTPRKNSEFVTRYTPDPQLLQPRQFVRSTLRSLRASRAIAARFLVRDLRARYRRSVLGYLWLLAPPLATTLLWVLLNASGVINVGDTGIPYPVFALFGTLLFQGFLDGLDAPLQQLDAGATLLGKVNFPVESLFISGALNALLNVMIRLVVAIPVLIIFGVNPGPAFLLAPFGALTLVVLGFAVGLAVAPIGSLYQDVPQAIAFAKTFLFLITPVTYAPREEGIGNLLFRLNPIAQLLVVARDWATGGPLAPPLGWYVVVVGSTIVMALAWMFFRLALPHLVDRLST